MNPYDPNDALSDKSDEYTPDGTLTSDDRTEEFPIEEQLIMKLNVMQQETSNDEQYTPNILKQQQETSSSEAYEGYVSGETKSDETYQGSVRFLDPNNEIDSGGDVTISVTGERSETTRETEDTMLNVGVYLLENVEKQVCDEKKDYEPDLKVGANTSNELIHLLEEAKNLFDNLDDKEEEKVENPCERTSSEMELTEIETKLRECHLVKSQNFNKPDARINNLTLREQKSKPEPKQEKTTPAELEVQPINLPKNNFCELLYNSAFLSNPEEKDNYSTQPTEHTHVSENISKCTHVDDYQILSRAVQLLESRTSLQSIPNNCRGILGILALQQKLKELSNDREELETRLYKCNSDFMEFIDILSDKARIISINNKEVANFVKILNLKVPELEKITASHTESLEDIKYRFKERNLAKIIELRKQIEFYTLNIDKLNKKISKIKLDNTDIQRQMDGLDTDNINYKTYFTKKVAEVKANMDNLNSLNSELQRQLDLIQNSDLGKNENFKLKVPALKDEIENISNNIKDARREKNKYELENVELRKKLKQLILAKVMEKRSAPVTTAAAASAAAPTSPTATY